jgi:hypothetical protein
MRRGLCFLRISLPCFASSDQIWVLGHASRSTSQVTKVTLKSVDPDRRQQVKIDPVTITREVSSRPTVQGPGFGASLGQYSYTKRTKETSKLIERDVKGTEERPFFVIRNRERAPIPRSYVVRVIVRREGSSPLANYSGQAEPFSFDVHLSHQASMFTWLRSRPVQRWGMAAATISREFTTISISREYNDQVFAKYEGQDLGLLHAYRNLFPPLAGAPPGDPPGGQVASATSTPLPLLSNMSSPIQHLHSRSTPALSRPRMDKDRRRYSLPERTKARW